MDPSPITPAISIEADAAVRRILLFLHPRTPATPVAKRVWPLRVVILISFFVEHGARVVPAGPNWRAMIQVAASIVAAKPKLVVISSRSASPHAYAIIASSAAVVAVVEYAKNKTKCNASEQHCNIDKGQHHRGTRSVAARNCRYVNKISNE